MITRLFSLPIKGDNTLILAVDVLHESRDSKIFFVADADIDCDGSGGNPENDPYFQPETSYKLNDVSLDAYNVPFIVVPKSVINSVGSVVLGCRAKATYHKTGLSCDCIVGDVGPTRKLGELSVAAARAIGMPDSPNFGGDDSYNAVTYEMWPGQTTTINDIFYPLQPS